MSANQKPRRSGRRRKSAEIVSIHSGPLASAREPASSVIENLEWLLELARAGEIVTTAVVFGYSDGSHGFSFQGVNTRQRLYGRVGALAVLSAQITDLAE